MRKIVLILVLACFTATGCTGSFNLTKKVYDLHRSQDDKWKDEFVFLVVALLPIYSISTLADAIVFNSIEFWTGENPVALNASEGKTKYSKEGKKDATLSYNPQREQMTILADRVGKLVLEKRSDMVLARNEKGDVVYSSLKNEKGDVVVYDQNLKPFKTFTAHQINSVKEKYFK